MKDTNQTTSNGNQSATLNINPETIQALALAVFQSLSVRHWIAFCAVAEIAGFKFDADAKLISEKSEITQPALNEITPAIKSAIADAVADAISDYDFSSEISDAVSDQIYDAVSDQISEATSDAVANHDFSDEINSALDGFDWESKFKAWFKDLLGG